MSQTDRPGASSRPSPEPPRAGTHRVADRTTRAANTVPANEPARLYGIGLGPGDPELITVKGLRLLREADVVFLPTRGAGAASYAGTIADGYLEPARQEIVPLLYPAVRGERALPIWDDNADRIAAHLAGGRLGAFLTEGDPLLYSTFVHALLPLHTRHPGVSVGVVPGIWSGSAAAAALRQPLVDSDERLAVLPTTYIGSELATIVRQFDSIVLLKPPEDLAPLRATLAQLGATAVWVERVGRPEQKLITDQAAWPPLRLDYFSLVIVRGGRHLGARKSGQVEATR
jgi:precorrin-2/cobalt-factor-2 C20-methyltransferase